MTKTLPLYKRFAAEAIGTFWVVFAGTGAIIVSDTGGVISHAGIALAFGLAVFTMIAALGDISGAHFNPAVTAGFFVAKRLPGRDVFPYVFAQLSGALLASFLLHVLFSGHLLLGATLPSGSAWQAWILEALLTLVLMFVILAVSVGAREKGITAGLAIGGTVALEALFAGPVSGASMNPARSLAPALVSGQFDFLWIYLTAPFAGSAIAVAFCLCTREEGCCTRTTPECAT